MHTLELFRLTPRHIAEFRSAKTLYISDFRAASSSVGEHSTWLVYYENMLLPVVSAGTVVVNDGYLPSLQREGVHSCISAHPHGFVSIAERLPDTLNWDEIDQIWTAVPHPAIDRLAEMHGKKSTYSYTDFCRFNNKVLQKQCVPAELTSVWGKDSILDHVQPGYYLKHEFGCGGLEVCTVGHEKNYDGQNFREMIEKDPDHWYWEEEVQGVSCSVSLYTRGDDTVVFGWSEQIFATHAKTSCIGGTLHAPESLPIQVRQGLEACVSALLTGLLTTYQGFWGIDYIVSKETGNIVFLEANVRVTTVTIPQLLLGEMGHAEGVFEEDVITIPKNGRVTNWDSSSKTCDVLH